LACTFFNSVNRRLLQSAGFDPALEFEEPLPAGDRPPECGPPVLSLDLERMTADGVTAILSRFDFRTPFANPEEDARLSAARIEAQRRQVSGGGKALRVEMALSPFFREGEAYLIGRLQWRDGAMPLVFALENGKDGLRLDALLLRAEEIRVLFSFSHSYFFVQTACPRALVCFLKALMPAKRTAELYISLGYNKHGKTELYRDLLRHQRVCGEDRFQVAAGQRGMVMIAFAMSRDDLIYKLIRDRFASPKHSTRRQVQEKYDMVFRHDRAGRLMDVQTFENLEIGRCCFAPELLAEIQSEARLTTSLRGDRVILHHVYVERRLTPLDLFLRQADPAGAEAAIIDYGQAIKDLARIDIFPGDMLLKNFGVTPLGRVVFYDYDELCPLTDCHFRRLPQARSPEEEMDAEPWFAVGDNDVFPEEFGSFIAVPPALRPVFLEYHGDLLTPEFWQTAQELVRSGEAAPVRPYSDGQRLREGPP
jgi:isocitrate dehydrogenase kinase/phosphatase